MLPVVFRFGSVSLYSYGLMLALAFLACWVVARWYLTRQGFDGQIALDLVLAAASGGIVGARALYVAGHWDVFSADPAAIFMLQRGGMVFYGGLAGGAAAVAGYVLLRRLPVAVIADGAALTVPLGSAIGRLGCFLNGCCAGRVTRGWFGVRFPGTSAAVIPTQLIDSAANLLILAALLHLAVRRRSRSGMLWWLFMMLYATSRYLVEMLRVNPTIALGLTQAQLISVPVFAIGLAGAAWSMSRSRDAFEKTSDV